MQQYFAHSKDKNTLFLNDDDLNHIKNVMRMKENDEIIVVYDSNTDVRDVGFLFNNLVKLYKNNSNFLIFVINAKTHIQPVACLFKSTR